MTRSHFFVTGASQGLGLRVATSLAASGHSVSTMARRLPAAPIGSHEKVSSYEGDVGVEADVGRAFEQAFGRFGPLSGIVHCAGVLGFPQRIGDDTAESWNSVLRTNLLGTFNVLNAGTSNFADTGGTFIGLSGGGATSPMPGLSAYAASKAGVVRLLETAAMELLPQNISVIAVAPGIMMTKMVEDTLRYNPKALDEEYLARMVASKESGEDHIEDACDLLLEILSNPTLARTCSGRLVSAVWDNWREWALDPDLKFSEGELKLRRLLT